jgi:hypothetical protein
LTSQDEDSRDPDTSLNEGERKIFFIKANNKKFDNTEKIIAILIEELFIFLYLRFPRQLPL